MQVYEKGFCLLGVTALLSLLFVLGNYQPNLAGAAVLGCPQGYTFVAGYCVENACQTRGVKCLRQGILVKRPDCHCTAYLGKFVCGVKGGERTAVKLPTCTRRGQLNSICGAYDSRVKRCVLK